MAVKASITSNSLPIRLGDFTSFAFYTGQK